jgi:hypothetical protein
MGVQHQGSGGNFECGVHGVLTDFHLQDYAHAGHTKKGYFHSPFYTARQLTITAP